MIVEDTFVVEIEEGMIVEEGMVVEEGMIVEEYKHFEEHVGGTLVLVDDWVWPVVHMVGVVLIDSCTHNR